MLRSRRADLAEQELYALLLVHLALRGLMVAGQPPGPAVTRTRCPSSMPCGWSGVIFPSTPPFPPRQRRRMTELILIEIAAVPAERSRGRHNPRVVKRKMSNFPTKSRSAARAAPSQRLRYDEHIVIVAPPEPAPPAMAGRQRAVPTPRQVDRSPTPAR